MKVLIIGISGLVGGSLFRLYKAKSDEVFGTYNSFPVEGGVRLDITSKRKVRETIEGYQPRIVLMPAAYAGVDACEKNPALCRDINLMGTVNVAVACRKTGAKLVFFSSDYVFDGKIKLPRETNPVNPLNMYGKIKLEAEGYIRENNKEYLIVRTANVYGWELQKKNYVVRLINSLTKGERVKAYTNQFGTPTYVESLGETVYQLCEKGAQGIFHVAGASFLSRFEFAVMVARIFELPQGLVEASIYKKENQTVDRPTYGGLDSDKVCKLLDIKMDTSEEGLRKMKDSINTW